MTAKTAAAYVVLFNTEQQLDIITVKLHCTGSVSTALRQHSGLQHGDDL